MNSKATSTTTSPTTSKVGAKIVDISLVDKSGRYQIGVATRPRIVQDNGFLDAFPHEEPTAADRIQLAFWRAKLETAEAVRPDLVDATAAYRHFLYGNGVDRNFNYERYVSSDPSGAKAFQSMLNDFKFHVAIIGEHREFFQVTSQPYAIGADAVFFPYPVTENWQKAIGAHYAWISADIQVRTDKEDLRNSFEATVVLHAEDRYNFNPGAHDIATGVPDSDNGRFEITGLAHQFTNYSTLQRSIKWKEGDGENASVSGAPSDRQRRPADSRRLRNRI